MSLDIRGYFMHIDRARLLKIATGSLKKMSGYKVGLTDDVPLPSGGATDGADNVGGGARL